MEKEQDKPEKMDLRSMDVADDKRRQLAQLFPEVVTEVWEEGTTNRHESTRMGKYRYAVDFEKLKGVLGESSEILENQRERYGMTWPGKNECLKIIQQPSIATLKPCREESVNFDETENLFIEGDNLEALKLLQKAYYGKVKMIYIDPPYNTGKEFIYPDNYSETLDTYLAYSGQVDDEGKRFSTNTEAEGRYHSKWMQMMFPRLYMARNLLTPDGVLFASIDDNEVKNLQALLDEVFGEENFVATIIWQHSVQPKGYADKYSVHHNYILCYRKSADYVVQPLDRTEKDNKHYSNPDNDPNGPWRAGDVRNALYRPNLIYNLQTPSGKTITPPENGWRWSRETMEEKIQSGEIVFSEDETRITRKIYLKNQTGRAAETIWFSEDVGSTREANNVLKELFEGEVPFDTAKPPKLIDRIKQVAGLSKGDVVLDFFAGSASVGHSVLADTNYPASFILVQLPEPVSDGTPQGKTALKLGLETVADVGKERLRRVIAAAAKQQTETLDIEARPDDLGFRVFKLDRSNFRLWDGSQPGEAPDLPASGDAQAEKIAKQLELHEQHIDPNAMQEDILYEILLKAGFPLTTKVEKVQMAGKEVFSIAEGALLICLQDEITKELIKAMADADPLQVICLDSGFKNNDQLKANAVQTFKARNKSAETATVFRTV